MEDSRATEKLTTITWLLVAILGVMAVSSIALVVGLLPKIERAVSAVERVEGRFQQFAENVEPVLGEGVGKAAETIRGIDSEALSDAATEKADEILDTAAERAKRFLNRDRAE